MSVDWLDGAREAGYAGHCWGNHFDFSTRSGCMKAHTPTIVWSGLIGLAFTALLLPPRHAPAGYLDPTQGS